MDKDFVKINYAELRALSSKSNALKKVREQFGVSRKEAEKILRDYESFESRLSRKRWITTVAGVGIIGCAYLASFARDNEREESVRVMGEKSISVEDIVRKYGNIDRVVNEEGKGNLYLIAQRHGTNRFNNKGYISGEVEHDEKILDIQTEITLMLKELRESRNLDLLVGEGYNGRFCVFEGPASRGNIRRYFIENPLETSPEILRSICPRLRVAGVELSRYHKYQNVEIKKKMSARVNDYLDGKLKVKPSEHGMITDAGELARIDSGMVEIVKEDCRLHEAYSRTHLKQGLAAADKLGVMDVAIVVGMRNVPIMIKDYDGKRKMIVIRPKSMETDLNSLPETDFEGFKKFYDIE